MVVLVMLVLVVVCVYTHVTKCVLPHYLSLLLVVTMYFTYHPLNT